MGQPLEAGAQHRRGRPEFEPPRHARTLPAAGGHPPAAWRIDIPTRRRPPCGCPGQRRHARDQPHRWHHHPGEGLTMDRPQPRFPEPDTQPFWDATREHKLTYQVDRDTGDVVFFPRAHNPKNGSRNLEWRESKGEGTIYSYSVVRLNRHPALSPLAPY